LEHLERQRYRIAALEAENAELRAQLDALRRGEGIAVIIQGHSVPLATLMAQVSEQQRYEPAAAYPVEAYPPSVPLDHYHHPVQHVPLPAPQTPPAVPGGEESFPGEAWLTSPAPAVRPVQRARPSSARALRPSEHITPDWLREAPQQQQSAQAPTPEDAWRDGYPPAVPARQARRSAEARRTPVPSEPLPSLAQLTGQHPAYRPRRRNDEGRNPYSDSFVLD
ncbi:MAG: hypothetical protein ACHQ4H_14665, partial [Ktedonobacterales bacterium]